MDFPDELRVQPELIGLDHSAFKDERAFLDVECVDEL